MKPVEFWVWEYTNPRTGKRRKTTWKARAGCQTLEGLIDPAPVPNTREVRDVPETLEEMEAATGGAAVRVGMERLERP